MSSALNTSQGVGRGSAVRPPTLLTTATLHCRWAEAIGATPRSSEGMLVIILPARTNRTRAHLRLIAEDLRRHGVPVRVCDPNDAVASPQQPPPLIRDAATPRVL